MNINTTNTIKVMAVSYVTEEGLNKMKEELKHLETVERPAVSRQIAEARDKGDLSENAEYDAAKEAQGLLEMKISLLKEKIVNARLIDESRLGTDNVQILNKVQIKNKKNNQVMTYTLVSEHEANLKEGKLAINTPIAQALLGKRVGDIVEVTVPAGKIPFEIIDISI
jgi:transcription elongation factor GreA